MKHTDSEMADLMSEAIALSSPSGRMSGRARRAADKRFDLALFGPNGLPWPSCQQPTKAESLRRSAAMLRDLADRGMKPRAYAKEAERLEAEADKIEQLEKEKA